MTRALIALLTLAVLAFAAWAFYDIGLATGRNEIRLDWAKQRAADAGVTLALAQKFREREQAFQTTANQIRQERNHEIHRLSAAHDAAVRKLRNRPERPADYLPATSQDAGTGPAAGCSADQLFRQDAAVALGIARDADLVRIALQQCHAQYQAAADAAEPANH